MNIGKLIHRQISVARVYGIPVRIDYRWFAVFAMSVWLISLNLQRGVRGLPPVEPISAWVLAVLTTLAFFLSVFGHELSHALVGRMEGIEIEEIVLHPFGGLARLKSEPDTPGAEFRIAVAGPAASFMFAVLAFGAYQVALIGMYRTAAAILFFIGSANLLLAVFNLFPGYPLDGGRVLRALLWKRRGNITEATRIAGLCGIFIAVSLILIGVYMAISPKWQGTLSGLWSVLVGLFLFDAAAGVVRHARNMRQATVADAMIAPVAIEPEMTISRFVDSILPLHRRTSFPVARNRQLHGILALEDLKTLPRERWRQTLARDVMRPVDATLFVEATATMARAEEIMRLNGTGSLAVIDQTGQLVGFLQRGHLKKIKNAKPKMPD
ncbi:MAG TPA: site-2 protease family protein [Pyrinomonadaceae bacterium]|nr:site-2 protease family protein [Pyrinomonadaceae bacterium]